MINDIVVKQRINPDLFPAECGLLIFRQGESPLFHIRTNNLAKLSSYLFGVSDREQSLIHKLEPVLKIFDRIEYTAVKEPFDALYQEKIFLNKEKPLFLGRIRTYDDYTYLAIDYKNYPFVSMVDTTHEDKFCLGPFSDRFFLLELLDIVNQYEHTPVCQDNTEPPCNLYGEKLCPGYCLGNNIEHLAEKLNRNFVLSNHDLILDIEQKFEKLQEDLLFIRADSFSGDLKILRKYAEYLKFLATCKQLNYSFEQGGVVFTIQDGLLDRVRRGNVLEVLRNVTTPFQDYSSNELLAIPKDQFAEMRTVYQKVSELAPEIIDQIASKGN